MKPILLLQYRTDESLHHEQHCIASKLGLTINDLDIRNVIEEQELPKPHQLSTYSGVISGASGQFNVTDWKLEIQKAIERTYPLMDEILCQDFPFLAICFGHQLLAKMYGGRVERDPSKAESESSQIILTPSGRNSPLYTSFQKSFYACNGHKDSVVEMPKGAKHLAISEKCFIQSYSLGQNIFTTQFHPELDLEGVKYRLRLQQEYLFGKTIEEILSEYQNISLSGTILRNFKDIMKKREKSF